MLEELLDVGVVVKGIVEDGVVIEEITEEMVACTGSELEVFLCLLAIKAGVGYRTIGSLTKDKVVADSTGPGSAVVKTGNRAENNIAIVCEIILTI